MGGVLCFPAEKGDPFAAFLSTVPMVEWKDSRLTLYTSHAFYRDWVLEESNYRSLQNIFRFIRMRPPACGLPSVRRRKPHRRNG